MKGRGTEKTEVYYNPFRVVSTVIDFIDNAAGRIDGCVDQTRPLLLNDIEGVQMKKELAVLLKKLPIQDVGHLRNEINQPPFGVDTMVPILCPSCTEDFKIDLPMEANFFFPRKKEIRTQA